MMSTVDALVSIRVRLEVLMTGFEEVLNLIDQTIPKGAGNEEREDGEGTS